MLRRLHPDQPASFAFSPANLAWARAQIAKYPEGRQASAVIPLLWRAQEQEGWLTRAAIEQVADLLGMARIRALEVATFYFMFQLAPVGSVAHVQVCGTTSCMICGAEALVEVCKRRIAPGPHMLSADGRLSWEEVECLGACANAPMAQIGKDYYEDLTPARFEWLLDEFLAGRVPAPGPQGGRHGAEPAGGRTSLKLHPDSHADGNASVALARARGDTIRRIDGSEPPPAAVAVAAAAPAVAPAGAAARPAALAAARPGGPDDLTIIRGVGPKLAALLNRLGFFHFDQIAAWTPAEIAWVDANLEAFKGRVSRDGWVEQARALAAAGGPGRPGAAGTGVGARRPSGEDKG
ncbi:MAG: NADH-quinone oxidoreductase subunit NuoE [Rhodobacteraceae bacterium]|nr:NADH-quinone oxidoreductase subunit NuoE [Paracoccaceae bacterium]